MRYFPSAGGTTSLELHSQSHTNGAAPQLGPKTVPAVTKAAISSAAAKSAPLDILPLSFTVDPETLEFATAFVKAGQSVGARVAVDIRHFLPGAATVTSSAAALVDRCRKLFVHEELKSAMSTGGGITTDVLNQKSQQRKFYDLSVCYCKVKGGN